MQRSRKNKFFPLLFFPFFWCFAQLSIAESFGVVVKEAGLLLEKEGFELNANIIYGLSPAAQQALQSGIPLSWNVRIIIRRKRPFFWDEKLLDEKLHYSIRYHPLLNVYQVTDQYHGKIDNFTHLPTALHDLGLIHCSLIIKPDIMQRNNQMTAALKVEFDREALPLPLRPVAYFDSSWNLSSEWFLWIVQNSFHTE